MKRISIILCICAVTLLIASGVLAAVPDYYLGDTSIYVGSTGGNPIKPNVLFFVDTSKEMGDIGTEGVYDPDNSPYSGTYAAGDIFYKDNEVYKDAHVTMATLQYPAAYAALAANGTFVGCISNQGAICDNKTVYYATGDYLNYKGSATATSEWLPSHNYNVGDLVYENGLDADSQLYRCVSATDDNSDGYTKSGGPDPFLVTLESYPDNELVWEPVMPLIEVVAHELNVIFADIAPLANIGLMEYNSNDQGGAIAIPVAANTAAQLATVLENDIVPITQTANAQPVGSALWDAWLYWVGDPTGGGDYMIDEETSELDDGNHANSTANDNADYDTSPITAWCQPNHMIVLATGALFDNLGASNPVAVLDTDEVLGADQDDGFYGPEAAYYLYNYLDYMVDGERSQVNTHVIQLMSPFLQQLKRTADEGHGLYVNVSRASEIRDAIMKVLLGILETDSSFVAPVVPASPENRAYSGERVYLGFFRPMNDEPWYGNLKKFGLDRYFHIMAFDPTQTDADGNDELVLATGADGYFKTDADDNPSIYSFWGPFAEIGASLVGSGVLDGGVVEMGGVGWKLKQRIANGTRARARNILTYDGDANGAMTKFCYGDLCPGTTDIDNRDRLTADLNLDPDDELTSEEELAEVSKLMEYIHGYDAYLNSGEPRSWVLGDIMHSVPAVFNYQQFSFTDANEESCSVNRGYIFVGGNDGMLHAFRDCDGEEEWAFIPPDLLPNLQYYSDIESHFYFVDGTPVIYAYDSDGDRTVIPNTDWADYGNDDTDDKVLLLCGMRRGGGSSTLTDGSQGSYFALDISDPDNPKYLGAMNAATTGFEEMGQTWSTPRFAKMKIDSSDKIVAIFGAGYDTNEDLRFGATQYFPGETDDNDTPYDTSDDVVVTAGTGSGTVTSNASSGEGNVISSGDGTYYKYKPSGRGLYIIEVATLNNGEPTFVNAATEIWSYTIDWPTQPVRWAFPSDPLVVDKDHDGYADRIYIGDTGGNLWRFKVGSTSTTDWEAMRIFQANPGVDDDGAVDANDVGRKVFYKPTATVKGFDTFIYFGTGDRAHALNTSVVDRYYVVRDREVPDYLTDSTAIAEFKLNNHVWHYSFANPLTESKLVDVTDHDYTGLDARLKWPWFTDDGETTDNSDTYYGWFVKLNEVEVDGTSHAGEKVLAESKVVEGVVYFTTFQPSSYVQGTDPCVGSLGQARLYAVDAETGEAVYNFYSGNDTEDEAGNTVEVLGQQDRHLNVGGGIVAAPKINVDYQGNVTVSLNPGDDGGSTYFQTPTLETIDPIYPVYWMKW